MKKFIGCFLILLMMSTVLLTGCGDKKKGPVLPPTRLGTKGMSSASLEKEYGFESALMDADLVAHIRVGDWLSEKTESLITYYRADIIDKYKGDETGNIVLLQDGCSNVTFEGYPLFTHGNEVLVFCKSAVGVEYSNAYWIIGSFTTVLDAVTSESGEIYYMDRYGAFGDRSRELVNYESQTQLKAELKSSAMKKDSMVSDMEYNYSYIFKASDVEALVMKKLQK